MIMEKKEDILNPCGHRNSERVKALKKFPSSICPACLFERTEELEAENIRLKERIDELVAETKELGPIPGTTCPLCGFPSFDWVEEVANDEETAKVINEDFPDWEPHDGVCSRCAEYYKIKVGKW